MRIGIQIPSFTHPGGQERIAPTFVPLLADLAAKVPIRRRSDKAKVR